MRQLRPAAHMPAIAETIHNGLRDTVAVIEEAAMQTALAWLTALVGAFADLADPPTPRAVSCRGTSATALAQNDETAAPRRPGGRHPESLCLCASVVNSGRAVAELPPPVPASGRRGWPHGRAGRNTQGNQRKCYNQRDVFRRQERMDSRTATNSEGCG